MNIFSLLATMTLYGIICGIVPAVTGGLTLILTVWRPTRVLGIGVLLTGIASGCLIGSLMEFSSLSNHTAVPGIDLSIGGFGGLAGFGIGVGMGLVPGLPIFLIARFTKRAIKPHQATDRPALPGESI